MSSISTSGELSSDEQNPRIDAGDIAVLAVYFVLVLAAGFYSMCRANRGTVSGYFLAGRFMFWLPVGASVFASNIGSDHFIGLAGSGAASGISVGAFELNALIILQLAGWIFLPVFIASRVCTLPEYMSKRFGGRRIRTYLAVLSMLLYIFTKISVNLYSGAIYIQQSLHWNLYVSVGLLLAFTAICTVTGGLAAVIYTDTLQFFVMIIGAAIVAAKAFIEIGGYSSLREKYMMAVPDGLPSNGTLHDCGTPQPLSWQLLRGADDPDMPWPGFLFGQTPASIWYWCTDQMMVQRLLAAKSLSHAQGGTLFAGYTKILPLFFIVMPGMISRVLYKDTVACVDPKICMEKCQNPAGCSNVAYPLLVLHLMPSGLRGLMLAVMLAALMSDLTSVFNSASTLFTMDIWPMLRKKASVKELMIVGRAFVVVMVVISILWIPVVQETQGGQLFIYIQAISAYLSPPIAAVYILAVLIPRINEKGAFWGLILGFLVGVTRMVMDFAYPAPSCGHEDHRPPILRRVHYMYFAIILFWVTTSVAIVVSLLTNKPETFMLIRTTFWTRFSIEEREDDKDNLEMKVADNDSFQAIDKYSQTAEEATTMTDPSTPSTVDTDQPALPEKNKIGFTTFWHWFCGLNQAPKTLQQEQDFQEHLISIASLHQTKTEKITLGVALITVLVVTVGLFIYFSLPPS